MLATDETIKLLPNGLKRSKYKKFDSGDEEKNNVRTAPRAIISPWAKLTILVTP
jgi:hypothetical protein